MSKHQDRQRIIRHYKEVTGKTDVDMKAVAKWAVQSKLMTLPTPTDAYDLLAKHFSESAREETRYDKKTGRPYRANHTYIHNQGQQVFHLWIDIDDPSATRKKMDMSLKLRREQMVSDGLQLTLDADHWNGIHADEEPLDMPMDLRDDIEWRKNAPEEGQKTG